MNKITKRQQATGCSKQKATEIENEGRQRLVNFIKEHPYPDYDFVSYYDLLLKQEQTLPQYADYNHDFVNENYEHIIDQNLIRKHGETIHSRGGKTALQQDCCTLLSVSVRALD